MCGDRQVLFDEIDNIKQLKGPEKFISTRARKYKRQKEDGLHYFLFFGKFEVFTYKACPRSISEDVACYFTLPQTITYSAIEFAIYMGFKEIYLLGVDNSYPVSIDIHGNKVVDNSVKSHFSGGGFKDFRLNSFYSDAMNQCYQLCEDYAKAHGIKIYNATRGGKLEVFERVKLEDVVGKKLSEARDVS